MVDKITPEQQAVIDAHVPIMSRYEAASILEHLAHVGEAGMYPDDITPFTVGIALGRLHVNCSVEDPLGQILTGYLAYQSDFQRRMELTAKS